MNYRTTVILLSALIPSVFLSGCASLAATGGPKPPTGFSQDSDTVANSYGKAGASSLQAYFDGAPSQDSRNRYIAANLDVINVRYSDFIQNSALQRQGLDTLYDFVTMSLGVAGAAFTGNTVKTVLAASTATVSGTKTSIDKNFYYQKTESALVSAMNAARKQALVPILTGMGLPLDKYTIGQAVSDLHDYYYAGTYLGAIDTVQMDADKSKAQAEAKILTLSNVTQVQIDSMKSVTANIEKLGSTDIPGMTAVVNNHKDRLATEADAASTVDGLKAQLHDISRHTAPQDTGALVQEYKSNNIWK